MSDLSEMLKDLSRAIELEDFPAANQIARELVSEAREYGFGELGEELQHAIIRGDMSLIHQLCTALGRKAADIDVRNNEFFGHGYSAAIMTADMALFGAHTS